MFKQMSYVLRLLAGTALIATTFAVSANSISSTINFDSLALGANPDLDPVAQANGMTFRSGYLAADLDQDGYEILDSSGNLVPGFTHWEAYASFSLAVDDPSTVGYGPAPSLTNALDGRIDEILVQFAQPTVLDGFSVRMALGMPGAPPFGSPFDVRISFLDANGKTLFDSLARMLVVVCRSHSLCRQTSSPSLVIVMADIETIIGIGEDNGGESRCGEHSQDHDKGSNSFHRNVPF